MLFLDSGGYEATKDAELSDFGERDHFPQPWTQEMHEQVVEKWQSRSTTVLVSYDHPKDACPIPDQIARARKLAPGRTDVVREILLKPETERQTLLKIESVLPHVHKLADFDIIGVAEKEIGNSIFGRMEFIARLRRKLESVDLHIPIHVFGSLDTITTPMYFVAGADIFDGLTWLRFAFHEGATIYKHNFGALKLGIKTAAHIIDGSVWNSNYRYLVDLELDMRRFLNEHDFSCFKHHSPQLKDAHSSVVEALED